MPILKKHQKDNAPAPTETGRATTAQQLSSNLGAQEPLGVHSSNRAMDEGYPGYDRQDYPGYDRQGYAPEPGQGTGYGTGAHGYQTGMNESEPYQDFATGMDTGTDTGPGMGTGAGMGTGTGIHGTQHATVPPAGTLNDQNQTRTGAGQKVRGKMQSALGSMVGSETLKVRGLQKEQEAKAFKVQGDELAQAERLEREAMARRERAVGHGAHPANRNLGAGMQDRFP